MLYALTGTPHDVGTAMATISAESTPNPNSLKFTASEGPFRHDGVASFSSADEATDHSFAQRLFALEGIADVFITPQFVTVSKRPDAQWGDTIRDIKSILSAHLEQGARSS